VELADIFRAAGAAYRESHTLVPQQQRAMHAIETCRTAALGGHVEQCDRCGHLKISYNSCSNRHCPKCQTRAKERWLAARRADLLPVPYFHVVFTLPHHLNPLTQGNPRLLYDMLFKATAETLLDFGHNPRWLGGEAGVTLVLHTWGQNLNQHLHVHGIIAGCALAPGGDQWVKARSGFLFPVQALAQVFRGKYLARLKRAETEGQFKFAGSTSALAKPAEFKRFVARLYQTDWVVYTKQPFAGPEQVLEYLGRYTHRVAISNNRLFAFTEGKVRFRWRDYAAGNKSKIMTLATDEFIRRFLLHVLPRGFVRIRHYGFLAKRGRTGKLGQLRELLEVPTPAAIEPETAEAFVLRVAGIDIHRCPSCGEGRLIIIEHRPPPHHARSPPSRH
jgi:Putative transposase/Transposase zinc-binding domain